MSIKPDTKNLLAASLGDLLKSRSYDKITVQKIVNHCGASRAVFYRHFKDKQDLMQWFFRTQMEMGFAAYEESIPLWRENILRVVKLLYEHRQIVKKLVSYKGQNSFTDLVYDSGLRHTLNMAKIMLKTKDLSSELTASVKMWVGGVSYTLIDWIERGCPEPSEAIAEAIIENCPARLIFIFSNAL